MAKCIMCGKKGLLLKVTDEGLCSPCELERMVTLREEFFISKTHHTYLPSNYIFFLALDHVDRRFALAVQSMSQPLRVFFFDYSDLISFDTVENKTIDNTYNSIMVRMFVNSLHRPQVAFYLINSPVAYGTRRFNRIVRIKNEIEGYLHLIHHNGAKQKQADIVADDTWIESSKKESRLLE